MPGLQVVYLSMTASVDVVGNLQPLHFPMSLSVTYAIILGSLAVALYLYSFRLRSKQRILPFPPGPKGLPIIGNLLDLPAKNEWLQYHKWSRQYGQLSFPSVQRTLAND